MMYSANDIIGIIRHAYVRLAGCKNNSCCWVPFCIILASRHSINCGCTYILVRVDVRDDAKAGRRE